MAFSAAPKPLCLPALRAGKENAMSSRRKSLPSTSRFHSFEPLESRQMMAGNLTANLTSGTLFINEANFNFGRDQAVQVSQLLTGHVRITGLQAQDGGTTLINGKTSVVF